MLYAVALTPLEKKAAKKSAIHLGLLTLGLAGALYFNRPGKKELHFQMPCREFTAPVIVRLSLHQSPTSVEAVSAKGFDGAVKRVTSLRFARDSKAPVPIAAREFTLARSGDANQAPPALELKPSGDSGRNELRVLRGAVLKSVGGPGITPVLNIESEQKGDVRLMLGCDRVSLSGNRYEIPEIVPKALLQGIRAEAGGDFLVGVELDSEAPAVVDSDAHLTARPSMEIKLDKDSGPLPFVTEDGQRQRAIPLAADAPPLDCRGSVNPDLRLEEKSLPGTMADRSVNLRLQPGPGRIERISIDSSSEKRNAPALTIEGVLQTSSVRQDGHELLPTRVEEVLAEPYALRGPILIGAAFVVFAALKMVDHALGVLLEIYLPKGS